MFQSLMIVIKKEYSRELTFADLVWKEVGERKRCMFMLNRIFQYSKDGGIHLGVNLGSLLKWKVFSKRVLACAQCLMTKSVSQKA